MFIQLRGVRERETTTDTDVKAVGSLLEEKLVNVADAERKVAGWTFALSRIYSSVDTPMRPRVSGEIMFVCFRYATLCRMLDCSTIRTIGTEHETEQRTVHAFRENVTS
jgi:hypothetical protein